MAKFICPACSGTGGPPSLPCSECDGKKTVARRQCIRLMAKESHHREGVCEIDDNAKLSETKPGDGDNGCYVQAWVWVEFDGTQLDKERAAPR